MAPSGVTGDVIYGRPLPYLYIFVVDDCVCEYLELASGLFYFPSPKVQTPMCK